jgi:hypothetical protein
MDKKDHLMAEKGPKGASHTKNILKRDSLIFFFINKRGSVLFPPVLNNVPYTNAKRAATSSGIRMESFSPNIAANSRKKIDGLPISEEVKATG